MGSQATHAPIPADTVQALAEMFRALGDTTRVRILDALSHDERCVGDLADLLGASQSAVSHQLRILRGLRLVRARRSGRLVFYALDDHHVVRLFAQGLQHVEERRPSVAMGPLLTAETRARLPVGNATPQDRPDRGES